MKRVWSILLLFSLGVPSRGQNFTGGFQFALPPADTGSTRFLPAFGIAPLTDQDFLTVDNAGHFSVRGKPIRFFGVNLVADGAFPAAGKVWSVAGRLRKMGVNLVRFHHIDNPWGSGSLFAQGSTTRQLNPVTLDRMDLLLAELRKNGIYANVNLHVSRTFTAMDGLPDTDSLQEFGKAINYFDPAVLSLHKEFASQLLTHVNPYTGKRLVDDPVIAMIELTNENSLYRYWRDGKLKHLSQGGILTARHVRMLDSLWCVFLSGRYGSTSALGTAWNAGAIPGDGLNRIVNGTFESVPPSTGWVMENSSPASVTLARDSVPGGGGRYSARVQLTSADGTDWHVQLKQTGLSITNDVTYVVTFLARSDSSRTVTASLMKDASPWTWYGGLTAHLTQNWQTFTFLVRSPATVTFGIRLSFAVGAQAGSYWFDDIGLRAAGTKGLLAGESLESGQVGRIEYSECPGFTDARVSDMSAFTLSLEEEYYTAMRGYLRDTLGVRVPITGTNWNIGPADLAVQSRQDYIDNHAYWDHPTFPGIPWSSTDWRISNTPMVRAVDGGTISGLFAGAPVLGKPFTVSEYNHPFPNRFQSEAVLFIASYAGFHDADGVMFFDYNSTGDWDTDRIANYFSIHRNASLMSLFPSCAAAFRGGLITPGNQTLLLDYAPSDYLTLPKRDLSGWEGMSLFDRRLALTYSVRSRTFAATTPFQASGLPPPQSGPFSTDTKEIHWDPGGLLAVATQRFVGAAGFLGSFPDRAIGPLVLLTADGFGSITWISLTDDSLGRSRRSLVTLSSMVQNSSMVWDGTATIHNDWGGSPTAIAPLTLAVRLGINADSLRIFPLDPWGRDTKGSSTLAPTAINSFTWVIDQKQSQSMWFGIESIGEGGLTDVTGPDQTVPVVNGLAQNFPNPFNPSTRISYSIARAGHVSLRVFDLLGREVALLVDGEREQGLHSVEWEGTGYAGGIYFYRLQSGPFTGTKRMLLLR